MTDQTCGASITVVSSTTCLSNLRGVPFPQDASAAMRNNVAHRSTPDLKHWQTKQLVAVAASRHIESFADR